MPLRRITTPTVHTTNLVDGDAPYHQLMHIIGFANHTLIGKSTIMTYTFVSGATRDAGTPQQSRLL